MFIIDFSPASAAIWASFRQLYFRLEGVTSVRIKKRGNMKRARVSEHIKPEMKTK